MIIINHQDGTYTTELVRGNYFYSVKKGNLVEKTGNVIIDNKAVELNVTLLKPPVSGVTMDNCTSNGHTIKVGGTIQLSATITPAGTGKSITWLSGDTSIATVSASGLVTGIQRSTTPVTITASADGFSATCSVTIDYAEVTGVTVNPNYITLNVGETTQLSATVSPSTANPSVSWSSNYTSVASVSTAGFVTANAAGDAVITVISSANSSMKANCNVSVTNPIPKLTSTEWTINIVGASVSPLNPIDLFIGTRINNLLNFGNIIDSGLHQIGALYSNSSLINSARSGVPNWSDTGDGTVFICVRLNNNTGQVRTFSYTVNKIEKYDNNTQKETLILDNGVSGTSSVTIYKFLSLHFGGSTNNEKAWDIFPVSGAL